MSDTNDPVALESHDELSERSLRRSAKLVGIPLTIAFLLPWYMRREWVPSWELAEEAQASSFVLLPALGIAFLFAAYQRSWDLRTRRLVVGVSGLAALLLGFALLRAAASTGLFRELQSMGYVAVHVVLGSWVAAAGFEIAMHQRPRSRLLSALAAVGWLAMLVSLAIPLGRRLDFDESMLGGMIEGIDRGRSKGFVLFLFLVTPLIASIAGFVQALRRLGKDRDAAAAKGFRTSWLAYLLLPTPMVLLFTLGVVMTAANDTDIITNVVNVFALGFGALYGGALGLGHGLPALGSEGETPRWVRRGAMAVAVLLALTLVVRAIFPDRRDSRITELMQELAQATADALEGGEVDARYLGGYSEFDLRSAGDVLEGHPAEGQELEPVLYAIRFEVAGDGGRAAGWIALPESGELRWSGRNNSYGSLAHLDTLKRADPAVADIVTRTLEGATSVGCLPALDEPDVRGLPQAAADLRERLVREMCNDTTGDRYGEQVRTFRQAARGAARGALDRYVLVLRTPDGTNLAVEGALRFDTGLLWIGNPQLAGSATPE